MGDIQSPYLSQPVIYYDEEKQPNCGLVCHIWNKLSPHIELPICNLVIFTNMGKMRARPHCEPAYKAANGKWIIINKWAYPGTVPDEEWNYITSEYVVRNRQVGNGETINTSPPRHARRI